MFEINIHHGRKETLTFILRALLATALATVLTISAAAQTPSFQSLGQMPGAMAGGAGTEALAVSGDGSTIVGFAWVCPTGQPNCSPTTTTCKTEAWLWTVAGGYRTLGDLGNNCGSIAEVVSANGSVVGGSAPVGTNVFGGFRWTAATGMKAEPLLTDVNAMTPDGQMLAAGDAWVKTSGQNGTFGFFPGNQNQTEVSGLAGTSLNPIAVGAALEGQDQFGPTDHAFRWTPNTGLQDLGLTTGTQSISDCISSNGLVIGGQATDKNGFWRAFRWTATTGLMDLGTLPNGPESAVDASNQDGSVLVGHSLTSGSSSSDHAFRWTAKTGMQDLRSALQAAGVHTADNWVALQVATGVSDDGTVIVGWGIGPQTTQFPFGVTTPFRIVLPVP